MPAADDGPGEAAGQAAASRTNAPKQTPADASDPYADSEFKVHRRPHRAGTPLSLKETLLQRSEAKARDDLLKQIQQHMDRSQYDCEAAERANKYLKADSDVWGFSSWQLKYFPTEQTIRAPRFRNAETFRASLTHRSHWQPTIEAEGSSAGQPRVSRNTVCPARHAGYITKS